MIKFLKKLLAALCLLLSTMKSSAQLKAANTDELKVPPYQLPDLLKMQNGEAVKTAGDWTNRQRPYIYHLFEQVQFGKFPDHKIPIHFRVLEKDPAAMGGLATRKQVRIFLNQQDTAVYTDLLLYIPNKTNAKVPVFIGYNFGGNQAIQPDANILLTKHWVSSRSKGSVNNQASDSSRGTEASQWQVKEILLHGYAIATAYCGDLEPDYAEGWKTGIRTTMRQSLNVAPEDWGAMGAWAYGLCRIADYFEMDDQIDAKKIALFGHSRLGKAALWAAASDQRFSLVISNESGEGGATLSKRWFGETVKVITTSFPHWFISNYNAYSDRVSDLPVDGHMLLSLIAPRPLYVASAEGDSWSDPKGEFLSAKEAGKVYALFHKKGIDAGEEMPVVNHPVGETVRYHIRTGKHDVTQYDWSQYLAFATGQWEKK